MSKYDIIIKEQMKTNEAMSNAILNLSTQTSRLLKRVAALEALSNNNGSDLAEPHAAKSTPSNPQGGEE